MCHATTFTTWISTRKAIKVVASTQNQTRVHKFNIYYTLLPHQCFQKLRLKTSKIVSKKLRNFIWHRCQQITNTFQKKNLVFHNKWATMKSCPCFLVGGMGSHFWRLPPWHYYLTLTKHNNQPGDGGGLGFVAHHKHPWQGRKGRNITPHRGRAEIMDQCALVHWGIAHRPASRP